MARKLYLILLTGTILYFIAAVLVLTFKFPIFHYIWRRNQNKCPDTSVHHTIHGSAGHWDNSNTWKRLGNGSYVFSAYFDDRRTCESLVTVLGFGVSPEPPLLGTLVLENGLQVTLKSPAQKIILNSYARYDDQQLGPYAYSWLVPPDQDVINKLKSIMVKQDFLNATSEEAEIPIKFPVYSTMTFGVCIESPLFGPITRQTIMHSIEVNRALGAEWFTIYNAYASQEVVTVLREYVSEEIAEVVPNWGKDKPPNAPYFGNMLSVNDCAYRNMFRVKYLVFVDLDEFIVPRKAMSWQEMMKGLEGPYNGTYTFMNVFYVDKRTEAQLENHQKSVLSCKQNKSVYIDLPNFLSRTYRSPKTYPYPKRSKFITKPLHALKLGIHKVIQHNEEFLQVYVVPTEIGLLQHYRSVQIPLESVKKELNASWLLKDERALAFREKVLSGLRNKLCNEST